jgi:hypothetical protein
MRGHPFREPDPDAAVVSRGVDRFLHQVPDHAVPSRPRGPGARPFRLQRARRRPGWLRALDAVDDCGEVDSEGPRSTGVVPSRKLHHQLLHPIDGMLDVIQHVLLEFRIVAVPLRVLKHQRELRDDVLEVVHDERRHPVEASNFLASSSASVACICPGKSPPGALPS